MSTTPQTNPAAQTPAKGRQPNGRFANGNSGGPGNPFARQVAALRKVILNRLTEEDLLAITEALLAKAKEGSVGAAKLLLAYALGKPASAPDPDRLDGQELKHFKDQVETVNEVHELAVEVGRVVDRRPGPAGISDDYSALMQEMVRCSEKYDNPVCLQAVANTLKESDTGEGARPVWTPPSTNPAMRVEERFGSYGFSPGSPGGNRWRVQREEIDTGHGVVLGRWAASPFRQRGT